MHKKSLFKEKLLSYTHVCRASDPKPSPSVWFLLLKPRVSVPVKPLQRAADVNSYPEPPGEQALLSSDTCSDEQRVGEASPPLGHQDMGHVAGTTLLLPSKLDQWH